MKSFCHILFEILSSYFVGFFRITGRTVSKMWLLQDENDDLARTETLFRNNMPGSGHELVATAYLYHICRILKAWRFRPVNAVFGGWLGDCQNFIFSNTIETFCRNNLTCLGRESVETAYLDYLCRILKAWHFGLGNVESLETGYLDHLCRISKAWSFGLVNASFGGWLGNCQKSIFSNTIYIFYRNNLPGSGHEFVEMGQLGQLCWFSKTWWVRLGRIGFGWDKNLPWGRFGGVRFKAKN